MNAHDSFIDTVIFGFALIVLAATLPLWAPVYDIGVIGKFAFDLIRKRRK